MAARPARARRCWSSRRRAASGSPRCRSCATAGAEAIGTASASKHDAIRAQGAAHAIDYRTQDVKAEVERITGGEGVDVVLDALGEFRQSYSTAARRAGGW